MADNTSVVHIGENSPEHVAAKLTDLILFRLEGRKQSDVTRQQYLDTYGECLQAVRGYREWWPKK